MRSDLSRLRSAWLAGCSLGLVLACGGGDGTGPPGVGPPTDGEDAAEEAAVQRAGQASADFEQYVTDGNPDPVGALVANLQSDPSVADVQRFDSGGTVTATLEGVPFGLLVSELDRDQWTEADAGATSGALEGAGAGGSFGAAAVTSPISCEPANFPQSKHACILRSGLTAAGAVQDQSIEESLRRSGFDIVSPPWPTTAQEVVQLHQTLATCGVLYIRSHGGLSPNLAGSQGNVVLTEVEVPKKENRQILGAAFGDQAKRYFGRVTSTRTKKSHLSLSPEFFASVKYPNTLVFINACGSDAPGAVAGGTLKDAFLRNGAGAFLGWKSPVSASLAGSAATEVFGALAPKQATIQAVAVTITPAKPGAGEPYTPSATISPAQAGVEVSLSVRGTDGFTRDETQTTDGSGNVAFTEIPGGQGGVTDNVTVAAGGASNSATALNAVLNSPTLRGKTWSMRWFGGVASINGLNLLAQNDNPEFNLVCNNQKVAQTVTVVKFASAGAALGTR